LRLVLGLVQADRELPPRQPKTPAHV
jgi:hypothetical protein